MEMYKAVPSDTLIFVSPNIVVRPTLTRLLQSREKNTELHILPMNLRD